MASDKGIPNSVRVAGKVYTIEGATDSSLKTNEYGSIDHAKLKIGYYSDMSEAQIRDTVLHEVLHACEMAGGLDLKEREIAALATLLYGVLVDNPEFAKWLIKNG